MKLLFAIKRLTAAAGGAERVLCTICSELASRGHDVLIVTFDAPGDQPFYELDARVRLINLGIGDSSRPARISETVGRMQYLRRLVLAECPDVAVGFMHSMYIPLALAMSGSGIPVIGSEHIVPEHYRTRPLQYVLLNIAAAFLFKITVLSEVIRAGYLLPVRRRMVVMPNSVVLASEMTAVGYPKEHFTLLCVGRLDVQKDHVSLIRAFARISPEFPTWRLLIVGEGPLRSDLEYLIDQLGMVGKVTMPGVMTEISKAYLAAEAFVISSRYEAFGLVTAEAMSYGLPVIGFADCPGTNELIIDGLTGLLAEPGDDRSTSLAHSLSTLLSDPGLRCRLGEAGRQFIVERFSSEQVCDQWECLLEECLSPLSRLSTKNNREK